VSTTPPAPSSDPSARILDHRLTPVTARSGPATAAVALWAHTLRRMLGLRRPLRAKLLPLALAAIAYLPASAFLGIASLLPGELAGEVLPGPLEFYGFITTSVVLFTALVGPQALSPDRRHRTLGLLLASQLSRRSYLVATGGALVTVLLVVTLGPPLLVSLGLASLGIDGPAVLVVLWRALAAGTVLAVMLGSLGLAVSSLTDNRGFAAAGTFLSLVGLGIGVAVIDEALVVPDWLPMLDLTGLTFEVVARVYRETGPLGWLDGLDLLAGCTAWVAGLLAVVWLRYRRLGVAR
jgi:ABC-2 type transport system permease protein